MPTQHHKTDVLVIGAGPIGLFSIFECGMLRMKCHVVDTLDMIGGQCSALYPEKPIYDIPGHPMVTGYDLIEKLAAQAAPFQPTYHLGQQVETLNQTSDGSWIATTSTQTTIQAKVIFIAAGVGAFGPNRPPLPHLKDYEGKSVFYYVTKREDFRGKNVVIAGGGDSAVDWAISLAEVAEKIMFVHRRPKFRAAPESVDQLTALAQTGKIEMVIPYQLENLEGMNGHLTHVIVKDLDEKTRSLKADCLLPFFGLSMNLGPILNWNLNLSHNHILVDPATMSTNQKGIFAIGDIATYSHKLKLILCGFTEAAHAAHAARELVYPHEVLHFSYSTTQGIPSFIASH